MKETMGQIIRRLRKERNFTQEELAEQLNITAQAVSKWENETGMPDISQVVPLAAVFGVSTDTLFGTEGETEDREAERIIEEAEAPIRQGFGSDEEWFEGHRKAYQTLQEALEKYPCNMMLLDWAMGYGKMVADGYASRGEQEKADAVYNECIREASVIIRYGKDEERVRYAHRELIYIYCELKQFDKAEEQAAYFSRDYEARGSLKAEILSEKGDTDAEIAQRCRNFSDILGLFSHEVIRLGNAYARKQAYEDAYRTYRTVPDLIRMVYGDGEYTPPLHAVNYVYQKIASCCFRLGRAEEGYDWLEKDIGYCTGNAAHYNAKADKVETPLLRECRFSWFGEHYSAGKFLLDDFGRPEFDSVRETERFRRMMDRISRMEE